MKYFLFIVACGLAGMFLLWGFGGCVMLADFGSAARFVAERSNARTNAVIISVPLTPRKP